METNDKLKLILRSIIENATRNKRAIATKHYLLQDLEIIKEKTEEALKLVSDANSENGKLPISHIVQQSEQVCQYEPDNTTAMNCKHCGKPKWVHKCCSLV